MAAEDGGGAACGGAQVGAVPQGADLDPAVGARRGRDRVVGQQYRGADRLVQAFRGIVERGRERADPTYSSGKIALEAIPGADYGFSNFGGGTPATPVQSADHHDDLDRCLGGGRDRGSAGDLHRDRQSSSGRRHGLIRDNGVPIPSCGAQPVNGSGTATCTVTYPAAGTHVVTALYTGSPDGEFVGSTNGPDAIVRVATPTPPPSSPHRARSCRHDTSLSLSNATPATGTAVRYTATVSPAPDGGTVSFTDGDADIRGCTAQPVTNGTSTCKVTYGASGIHQIRAAYSGDAHFGASDSSPAPMTVSTRPSLRVAKQSLIVTEACPTQSGGCRLTSSVAVTPRGVKKAINLKRPQRSSRPARPGGSRFGLSPRARGTLRSDLRQHHSARLGVTVHVGVRDGNGSKGTQTLTFTVSGARARSLLA